MNPILLAQVDKINLRLNKPYLVHMLPKEVCL